MTMDARRGKRRSVASASCTEAVRSLLFTVYPNVPNGIFRGEMYKRHLPCSFLSIRAESQASGHHMFTRGSMSNMRLFPAVLCEKGNWSAWRVATLLSQVRI
jgi:hypothetical protein